MSGKKAKHKAVEDAIQTSTEAVEAMILPDAGVVLTRAAAAKGSAKTAETKPLPPEVAQKPVAQKSPAEWAYERIILYIQNFEEQLDPEQEMVMGHVTGGGGTMRIEGMGFFARDLVTFYGEVDPSKPQEDIESVYEKCKTMKKNQKTQFCQGQNSERLHGQRSGISEQI